MIVVVLGHTLNHYDIDRLAPLYPLIMLMHVLGEGANIVFLLVCGFQFKQKPAGVMLKKTIKQLIKPYLYVMLAITLVYPIRHRIEYGGWWYRTFLETMRWTLAFLFGTPEPGTVLWGIRLQWNCATWFLLALFVAYNVLNLILKLKNEAVQFLLVALCAALGYGLALVDLAYWCIPQGLLSVAFCYLGYLIHKYRLFDRMFSSPGIYAVLFFVSLYHILYGNFNMAHLEFNSFLLDYLGVACLGLLILLMGISIGKYECVLTDWIKTIGVYTYWIICIHSFELAAFPWYRFNKLAPENYQPVMFILEILLKAVIIGTICFVLKKMMLFNIQRKKKINGK